MKVKSKFNFVAVVTSEGEKRSGVSFNLELSVERRKNGRDREKVCACV